MFICSLFRCLIYMDIIARVHLSWLIWRVSPSKVWHCVCSHTISVWLLQLKISSINNRFFMRYLKNRITFYWLQLKKNIFLRPINHFLDFYNFEILISLSFSIFKYLKYQIKTKDLQKIHLLLVKDTCVILRISNHWNTYVTFPDSTDIKWT